ncbi:hypothetical protein ACJRO7_024549 [Eucalyptus globulus]|uniref:Uncharacterized protein n=1 Tax=Eucalyptus globulus TaxID=34317 RepID=A0ABD3KAF3_EUCGL
MRRASAPSRRFAPVVRCSSRGNACIPKLEPFSRTRLERNLREPPLIQKCENELADYCSMLEGDSSYSCWRAYFELKDLERCRPRDCGEKATPIFPLAGALHGLDIFLHALPPNLGSKAKGTLRRSTEAKATWQPPRRHRCPPRCGGRRRSRAAEVSRFRERRGRARRISTDSIGVPSLAAKPRMEMMEII